MKSRTVYWKAIAYHLTQNQQKEFATAPYFWKWIHQLFIFSMKPANVGFRGRKGGANMDIPSYIMGVAAGEKKGEGTVILEEGDYNFADANDDGNIVITKKEEG